MIENKSTNFIRISLIGMILSYYGRVIKKPITARIPILNMNLSESAKNLNLVGFGNRMDLIKSPFVVLNPVRITNAVTGL